MGWRETKAEARAVVHDTMKVPVILLSSLDADDSNSSGVYEIECRLHLKDKLLGDQAGTSLNAAERYEPTPKAIFWRAALADAGITLARNMVISVSSGEAYNIEAIQPHDVETVTVDLVRLDADDAAGLPLPE